jgi:hypothetical protein
LEERIDWRVFRNSSWQKEGLALTVQEHMEIWCVDGDGMVY